MKRAGFLLVASFGLTGCLTTGRDFPSDVDWVRKEATTKKDVQMILGTPFAVGNSGGIATWTYAYYKYQLMGNSFHKELKFYWTPNEVVKHFSFSSSFPPDLPPTEEGQELSPAATPAAAKPTARSNKKPYPRY